MFEYAPAGPNGAGFAIATSRFLGLMAPEAVPAIVAKVFALLDAEEASVAHVLDVLSDEGARERFALVEVVDRAKQVVRVTVRGEVVVDLGSATMSRLTWPTGATFVTGEARGVDSLRLSLVADHAEGARLPLARGVVNASEAAAVLGPSLARPIGEEPGWNATPQRDLPFGANPSAMMHPSRVTPAPMFADWPSIKTPEPATEYDPELTIRAPHHSDDDEEFGPPAVRDAAGWVPWDDERTEGAPEPSGASEPPAPETDERDPLDRTPQRIDLPGGGTTTGWTLMLPDGSELEAGTQIVVGRKPWRSDPDETATYYIVAPSPRREISGKHVEFAVVGNELHARDLNSTNGTLVLAPDKPPRLLHQGRAVNLDIGDTLDLGEGFRIVVGARK